jgi:hypothetical protein
VNERDLEHLADGDAIRREQLILCVASLSVHVTRYGRHETL